MGEIVRYKRDVWGEEVILGVSWDLLWVVAVAVLVLLVHGTHGRLTTICCFCGSICGAIIIRARIYNTPIATQTRAHANGHHCF